MSAFEGMEEQDRKRLKRLALGVLLQGVRARWRAEAVAESLDGTIIDLDDEEPLAPRKSCIRTYARTAGPTVRTHVRTYLRSECAPLRIAPLRFQTYVRTLRTYVVSYVLSCSRTHE